MGLLEMCTRRAEGIKEAHDGVWGGKEGRRKVLAGCQHAGSGQAQTSLTLELLQPHQSFLFLLYQFQDKPGKWKQG